MDKGSRAWLSGGESVAAFARGRERRILKGQSFERDHDVLENPVKTVKANVTVFQANEPVN